MRNTASPVSIILPCIDKNGVPCLQLPSASPPSHTWPPLLRALAIVLRHNDRRLAAVFVKLLSSSLHFPTLLLLFFLPSAYSFLNHFRSSLPTSSKTNSSLLMEQTHSANALTTATLPRLYPSPPPPSPPKPQPMSLFCPGLLGRGRRCVTSGFDTQCKAKHVSTSSTMTWETDDSRGSEARRRSRMPVVQNIRWVSRVTAASSLTWYPTRDPGCPGGGSPRSSATRCATLMAAMRRGCVHTTLHVAPRPASMPASNMYCGTCKSHHLCQFPVQRPASMPASNFVQQYLPGSRVPPHCSDSMPAS
jgi:hypothetical protein